MRQQHDFGGGFDGQWVAVVVLVAALAMALTELWQCWVSQQSTKKRQGL
jgi:hypothetical protein